MKSSTSENLCRRFSLAELNLATGDFSDENVIGKGGFGKVYKGFIDNKRTTAVAIKRRLASNPSLGQTDFAAEIETLSKFCHDNLVSLIGYCDEQGEMILVYEYMWNGTLADHLHKLSSDSNGGSTLSWNERLKICTGAGRGLDYLHSDCSIIHGAVKPTNILLDEDFTVKVSDFGLTSVKGSFGYFDQSDFTTGFLTKGSDTYAFGIILLEVLSGRRAVEEKLAEEVCMSIWAQENIRNGKADEIVASNLKGHISEDCLKTYVGVAESCLHPDPMKRLTMSRVVEQLESALEQQERNGSASQMSQYCPSGLTPKDENEVEVDQLSKAFSATAMKEDYVPFILFGETRDIVNDYFSLSYNVFAEILKNGEDATIERHHYMSKREFELREKDSKSLSSLEHENIVKLVVYNLGWRQQVLTYDFAPRGSLHDILHVQQGTGSSTNLYPALTWSQRIKIALGVARGLCYIHSYGSVHHNINSRNILVCDDETAKIIHPNLWDQCYCLDYFADDISHPKLKIDHGRADVYNFGVILLELLTGGKILGEGDLVTWALPQLDSNKVHEIVDARLEGEYPLEAVKKMAKVTQSCLGDEGYYHRKMDKVVQELELCLGETKSTETQIASNDA